MEVSDDIEKVVLVGNPNVGKSVIFRLLTGRYVTVSNYPGTTVEVTKGFSSFNQKKHLITDTPGVNNLIPMSEDEKVTRDILMNEGDSLIVQVADSKNLRRALLITIQLAEAGLSFVLVLNMLDEARSRGFSIAIKKLSEILGVDVIPAIAIQNRGMDKLKKSLNSPGKSKLLLKYHDRVEEAINQISDYLPDLNLSRRFLSLMILSGDESLKEWIEKNLSEEKRKVIDSIVERTQSHFREPLRTVLNRKKLEQVDKILEEVRTKKKTVKKGLSGFFDKMTMHPFWGFITLITVLYLTYQFVGNLGAQVGVDFLEGTVFEQYINPWMKQAVEFLVPVKIIQDFLVGEYGIITVALTYSIALILPIVTTFFIAFSILEDTGYLPRLAVMVNNIFKLMGLNGKAVLPMVLGLGCDTMATMTTRILGSNKERILVTLLLALGVPCSAQLGVILGILGILSFKAVLIWGGVVIGVMLVVGYLASLVIPGKDSDFILELPPLRMPQLSNTLIKTTARIEWYLKEAVPLFMLGTAVLFALDRTGMLVLLEKLASPVIVNFLGLPAETTESFIAGFLRRDYGVAGLFSMAKAGELNPVQIVVSMVTLTLFVPCIANYFMMIKERGFKVSLGMVLFIFPFAFLVGGALNFILIKTGISL